MEIQFYYFYTTRIAYSNGMCIHSDWTIYAVSGALLVRLSFERCRKQSHAYGVEMKSRRKPQFTLKHSCYCISSWVVIKKNKWTLSTSKQRYSSLRSMPTIHRKEHIRHILATDQSQLHVVQFSQHLKHCSPRLPGQKTRTMSWLRWLTEMQRV